MDKIKLARAYGKAFGKTPIEQAAIALYMDGYFSDLKQVIRDSVPELKYACCPDANAWVVLKHWQSDSWHIEYQCQDCNHWTPNCQIVKASSYTEALALQKELNRNL